jgi:hypothetical protein
MSAMKSCESRLRPFPWPCGNCGTRTVVPAVIDHTAKVRHDGLIYELHLPNIEVPRCQTCGATYPHRCGRRQGHGRPARPAALAHSGPDQGRDQGRRPQSARGRRKAWRCPGNDFPLAERRPHPVARHGQPLAGVFRFSPGARSASRSKPGPRSRPPKWRVGDRVKAIAPGAAGFAYHAGKRPRKPCTSLRQAKLVKGG